MPEPHVPNLSVSQDFTGEEFTAIYTTTVTLTGGRPPDPPVEHPSRRGRPGAHVTGPSSVPSSQLTPRPRRARRSKSMLFVVTTVLSPLAPCRRPSGR
jgi:hypothetical protein